MMRQVQIIYMMANNGTVQYGVNLTSYPNTYSAVYYAYFVRCFNEIV